MKKICQQNDIDDKSTIWYEGDMSIIYDMKKKSQQYDIIA